MDIDQKIKYNIVKFRAEVKRIKGFQEEKNKKRTVAKWFF